MANYSDYKKVTTEQIADGLVTDEMIVPGARKNYGIKWVYGSPNSVASGCCCNWTVPSGVSKLFFEIWGAGGNGHGSCSWDRCQHFKGAGGGQYNSKMINTAPGCQYTICAAGVYPCCSFGCTGCEGCSSYVNGYNLSGFCAVGGSRGCANTSWAETCYSAYDCCLQRGANGGDFGGISHSGRFGSVEWWFGVGFCHCHHQQTRPSRAPLVGTDVTYAINYCWIRHGCWTVPYANGAQGAQSSYCGNWDNGYGNTGGNGIVKITYF
ncbi:MAG: hypothetical protein CMG17_07010 [Candidatus Marinimicrobia bacterium]|jgi:hypothetical protein|nr:hypothetical protein [Candidatus Neomarinimicrobiota bacterium]|tara:strand:+ start:217 stop:1014 length:798 start_codon:yes stop_codon:yes gene_type:complete